MQAIFLKILNMSLTGSYLILAVMALRLVLKRFPKKYAFALWAVAGFRLVCPVSIRSPFSIFSLLPERSAQAVSQVGSAFTYIPTDIGYAAEPEVSVGIPVISDAVNHVLPAATPTASVNPLQLWILLGTVLWCVGIAVMLGWSVVSMMILRKRVEKATILEKGVYECENVPSPFILGIFSPKIYLPYNLEPEQLRYVLAHERCHIRKWDHITKVLGYAILAMHWFNPLCWVAYSLMGKDMEMRCDEYVLSKHHGPTEYSMSLLSVATNRRISLVGPLAFGESGTKSRIRNILCWKKPKIWKTILAVILCVACVLGCAVNPQVPASEENTQPMQDTRQSFVTGEQIFRSSLCSTFGGDDGFRYYLDEDTITQMHRESGTATIDKSFERPWEAFPFEADAWKAMFDWGVSYENVAIDFIARREDTSFRYIDAEHFLLHLDDTMYICNHNKHPNGDPYIWDIYTLKEEPSGRDAYGVEDPVVEFALQQMENMADYLFTMEDIQVEQYEILGIEKIPTGTANEVLELALYLFDYRLAVNDAEVQMPEDGITGQFWISRSGTSPVNYPLNLIAEENWLLPDQQTYLLLKRYVSDGTWTPMYVLTEEEIQELYATETMLAEYGDAYTAAAMEIWLGG